VLTRHQKVGNNAGDVAAAIEHGHGDFAHHADRAAAINEPDSVVGEHLAEFAGGLDEGRVRACS
jgi:hypothetical protein